MRNHGPDTTRTTQGERDAENALRGQGTYGSGGSYGVGGGFEDPRDGRPVGQETRDMRAYEQRWDLGQPRSSERGPFYGHAPRNYVRSDDRIREEACELLMRQGYIDPRNIEVRVAEGVIVLEGEVESRRDKHELEALVDDVLGVRDVDNRLRVKRTS